MSIPAVSRLWDIEMVEPQLTHTEDSRVCLHQLRRESIGIFWATGAHRGGEIWSVMAGLAGTTSLQVGMCFSGAQS